MIAEGCIDDWILGGYWTPQVVSALCQLHAEAPGGRASDASCTKVLQSVMGEDVWGDLLFEFEAASAFCGVFQVPFYVHTWYNAIASAARASRFGVQTQPKRIGLPFIGDGSQFERWPTAEELEPDAARPRDWSPAKTLAEREVDGCQHACCGSPVPLTLRGGLIDFDLWHSIANTRVRACQKCDARIVCDCIAAEVLGHLVS